MAAPAFDPRRTTLVASRRMALPLERRCSPVGHVVAAVNYHGSSGFGQKWPETIAGRYGEKELADTEAGTDWLLRQGYIDRTRLPPPAAATVAGWWRS